MNLRKITMMLLFFMATSLTAFAQKGIDSEVNKHIEYDNVKLTHSDKSLKLTPEQTAKAIEIYKTLVAYENGLSKSKKKKGAYKEEIMDKRIEADDAFKKLLTPKQLKAYTSYGDK